MRDRMKIDLNNYIVSENTSIVDAMKVISQGEKSVAFLCEGRKLLAAVSDGDIRRHLIAGGNVTDAVGLIANYDPVCVYNRDNSVNRTELMKKKAISALPVLDDDNRIIDIAFLNDVVPPKAQINLPVVMMAGGKGTRLRPYTQILPKALIPIGNKTITEHIIDRFSEYGCSHFDIIVNYKKDFIKSYFNDNEKQYDISFIEEERFLGTGGGLKLVEGKYKEPFFITNCDVLIETDYSKIYEHHKTHNNIITIVCATKKITLPYGTIEVDKEGFVRSMKEKPVFDFITNTGVYIADPGFISTIPVDTKIDITDIIAKCISEGSTVGTYIIDEDEWLDMGQLDEMDRMKRHLNISD